MRAKNLIIILFITAMSCLMLVVANAQNSILEIFVGDSSLDSSKAKIINDSIYVPLRWYSNFLGYNVQWNPEEQNVIIKGYQYPKYKAQEINGTYGYINENGEITISPQFKYAVDFSEGLGLVQNEDDTFDYINLQGQTVIEDISPYNYAFHDGVAIVIDYYEDLVDASGLENHSTSDRNYRTYYIDKSGNMLFGRYFANAGEFIDGLAFVQIEGSVRPEYGEKKVYTYIDMTGNYDPNITFDYASDFENGRAEVVKDGIKGIIDKEFNFYPYE